MPVCNAPKMAFMEMANNFEELLMGKETNMNDVLGMQDNPEHQNTRHKDVSCHGNAEQAKIQITLGYLHHELALKIGAQVMSLRNVDQKDGLCNGTRLQINRMGTDIIEAKIISE
ncbi:ATP-dependent DNA helicase PIF1-like protein, partial [Tanacetum coccineum]